jgi:hypothetical protein
MCVVSAKGAAVVGRLCQTPVFYPVVEAFVSNAWSGAWHKHRYNASRRLPLKLLSYFLKLLTDYRTVEAIDGNVKPIVFFSFHHEVVLKALCIGFVMACLRNQVDEQTPCARLCDL